MSNNELTTEDRKNIDLLIKHKELEFNWEEIKPFIKDLVNRYYDGQPLPIKIPPIKLPPTKYPDIIITKPDGTIETLEDLMKIAGIPLEALNSQFAIQPPKPTLKDFDIQIDIDFRKPAWIYWRLWEKFIAKGFSKFIKSYAAVKITDKKTGQIGESKTK